MHSSVKSIRSGIAHVTPGLIKGVQAVDHVVGEDHHSNRPRDVPSNSVPSNSSCRNQAYNVADSNGARGLDRIITVSPFVIAP